MDSYSTFVGLSALFFLWMFFIWSDDDRSNQHTKMALFVVSLANGVAAYQFFRENPNTIAIGAVSALTALACLKLFVMWKKDTRTNRYFRAIFMTGTLGHAFGALSMFGAF